MPRTVKPWEGKTDDSPIPPRVKLRVKSRADHRCQNCGIGVRYGGQVDHIIALILGGKNAESNLRFLCKNCHAAKTQTDLALKSRAAKTQKRVAGIKKPSKFPNARDKKWKTYLTSDGPVTKLRAEWEP